MRRNDLNFLVNKDIPIKCAANAPIDEKATRMPQRATDGKNSRIEIDVARMCRRPVCMQNNGALNINVIYVHTPRL